MNIEEEYKTLKFLETMISFGIVCEDCESKPGFPDSWFFIPDPNWPGAPVLCPTCLEKKARGE